MKTDPVVMPPVPRPGPDMIKEYSAVISAHDRHGELSAAFTLSSFRIILLFRWWSYDPGCLLHSVHIALNKKSSNLEFFYN